MIAYLVRIAHNLSIKIYHKKTAKKRNSTYDVALDELQDIFSDGESVESRYAAKELAEAINIFLDKTDRLERILFVRRYYFSEPVRELAAELGMSENSVSVKLHRIRKKLKKYLEKEGYSI